LISKIEEVFAGYEGSSTYSNIISVDIMDSHCFGLNHDVNLYGNDSTDPIEYRDDGTGSVPTIIYN
jgi:hypothetical protein